MILAFLNRQILQSWNVLKKKEQQALLYYQIVNTFIMQFITTKKN